MEHLHTGSAILLAAIAFLAGAINAVAGGGSLLTFPTLLALGFPPVTANVTNTVSLVPGYAGGIAGYRRELTDQHHHIRLLAPVSIAGAFVGSVILLTTSAKIFSALVPVLVLAASLLLLVQPVLQQMMNRRHPAGVEDGFTERRGPSIIGVFFAAIYGGYFGGVLGVILLAVLGIFLNDDLQKLNALKSVLQFMINIVAVVIFALFGPVQWWVVLIMAPCTLAGGWTGSHFARRLSPNLLRRSIGVYGIVCAVVLALR
jgi:uncharacterized membrane protein YfcA